MGKRYNFEAIKKANEQFNIPGESLYETELRGLELMKELLKQYVDSKTDDDNHNCSETNNNSSGPVFIEIDREYRFYKNRLNILLVDKDYNLIDERFYFILDEDPELLDFLDRKAKEGEANMRIKETGISNYLVVPAQNDAMLESNIKWMASSLNLKEDAKNGLFFCGDDKVKALLKTYLVNREFKVAFYKNVKEKCENKFLDYTLFGQVI